MNGWRWWGEAESVLRAEKARSFVKRVQPTISFEHSRSRYMIASTACCTVAPGTSSFSSVRCSVKEEDG
jgi:hypothetical protein